MRWNIIGRHPINQKTWQMSLHLLRSAIDGAGFLPGLFPRTSPRRNARKRIARSTIRYGPVAQPTNREAAPGSIPIAKNGMKPPTAALKSYAVREKRLCIPDMTTSCILGALQYIRRGTTNSTTKPPTQHTWKNA